MGCHVYGSFPINKISGKLYINYHSSMSIYFYLRSQYSDLFSRLNLSYEIIEFKFGHSHENYKSKQVKKMLKSMQIKKQLFENYVDHKINTFEHFTAAFWMELIPYTFIDENSGFQFKSIQHSFNRKVRVG